MQSTVARVTSTEAVRPQIERSPADVLRLVVALAIALVLVVIERLCGDTLVSFASALASGLHAVPGWIVDVVVVGTRVLGVVFFGGGLVWSLVGGRGRMLSTAALAVALSEVLTALHLLGDNPKGQVSIDVGVDLGPFGGRGFPTMWGIGAGVGGGTWD